MKKTLFLALAILTMVCLLVIGASAYEPTTEDTAAVAAGTPVKVVFVEPYDADGDEDIDEYYYCATITEALSFAGAYEHSETGEMVCDKIVILGDYTEGATVTLVPYDPNNLAPVANTADNPLVIEGNGFTITDIAFVIGDGTLETHVTLDGVVITNSTATVPATVSANATLTLTNATSITSTATSAATPAVVVSGHLVVSGAAGAPVVIETTTNTAYEYTGIRFLAGGTAKISYADISGVYGIHVKDELGVMADGNSIAIDNSTVTGTMTGKQWGGAIVSESGNITNATKIYVEDCTLQSNNSYGIQITSGKPTVTVEGGTITGHSGGINIASAIVLNLKNVTVTANGNRYNDGNKPAAVIYTSAASTVLNIGEGTKLYQKGANVYSTKDDTNGYNGIIVLAGNNCTLNITGVAGNKVEASTTYKAHEVDGIFIKNATTAVSISYLTITAPRPLQVANTVTNGITIANSTFITPTDATYNYNYGIYCNKQVKFTISDSTFTINKNDANNAAMRLAANLTGNYAMTLNNVTINGTGYGIRVGSTVELTAGSSVNGAGSIRNVFYVQSTLTLNAGCSITMSEGGGNGNSYGVIALHGASRSLICKGTDSNPVTIAWTGAAGYKSGIHIMTSASATLDLDYTNVTAPYSFCIYGAIADASEIRNCTIKSTSSKGSWSQITLDAGSTGTLDFYDCDIIGDYKYCAALMNSSAASFYFEGCDFSVTDGVVATAFIRWQSTTATGDVELVDCTISGNAATYGFNPGAGQKLTITNTTIDSTGNAIINAGADAEVIVTNSHLSSAKQTIYITGANANVTVTGGTLTATKGVVIQGTAAGALTLKDVAATAGNTAGLINASGNVSITILSGSYISTLNEILILVNGGATVDIYGGYFQHQGVYMFRVQGNEGVPSTLNIYGGYFYRPAVQKGQEDSSNFIRVGAYGTDKQIAGADTEEDTSDDVYEYIPAWYGVANVWGGTFVADYNDKGAAFATYSSQSVLNLQSYVAIGSAYVENHVNADLRSDEEGAPDPAVVVYHQNKAMYETTYNSLKIITGASMRLVYVADGDVTQSGLRFTSYVTKGFQEMIESKADDVDADGEKDVEYYTVIVPARFITSDYFTVESLTEAGANPLSIKAETGIAYNADGDMFIRASVYNLPHTSNGSQMTYTDGYAAIVYAKFTVDGQEVYQYAHFDASENVVSPADVANAALNNTSNEETGDYVNQIPVDGGFVWSPYTADERNILAVYAAESNAEEIVDVFVIAGQSNASGYSHMTDAFASAHSTGYSNVLYTGMAAYSGHTGAAGTYHNITPVNSGLGYSSKAIGAELGMADVLDAIYNADSNRTALIIKYADGGTYLSDHASSHKEGHNGNWMSPTSIAKLGKNHEYYTGRQYENLMEVIKKAVTEVRLQGYGIVNFKGMFWMQGESDRNISSLTVNGQEITFTKNGTDEYEMLDVNLPYSYPNLFKNLVTDFRRDVQQYADNDTSALPVVVGTISEAFGRVHHDANKCFIAMQKNTLPTYVSGITTLDISMLPVSRDNDNNDAAHWTAEDMFLIGQMVGATFAGLDNPAITTDASKAVAQIGSTYYTSLSYALGVAAEGQTVKLLKNITLTSTLNVANTKNITLDCGGYTVTTACNNAFRLIGTNLTIQNGKFALSSVTNFVVTHENAAYTLNDVSYEIANPEGKEPAAQVYNEEGVLIGTFYTIESAFDAIPEGGKISLLQSFESATSINLPENGTYTIDGNGNTFTYTGKGSVALYAAAGSDITVNNLNITVTDTTTTTYIAYGYEGSSLTVVGGTYTAPNYGFMMRKANVTLVLDGVTVNMTGTGAAPHASNPRTAIGFNSASTGASVTVRNGSSFVGADADNTYFVHINTADPVLAIDLDTTSISGMTFSELPQETVVLNGKLAGLSDVYNAEGDLVTNNATNRLNVLKGGSIFATVGTPTQVCINASTNYNKLYVTNYIDINGNATTFAKSPITLSSNGNIYNNYILLDRAEGGTMDDTGAYYYTVFIKSDELPKALGKVNVATGAVEYISDATMQLDHANDVAFIPGENGENDRLAVVLNGSHAKWVAIYEDTGSGFEFIEFVDTLPQNIWCLEYNATTQQYVAGVSGASFQYMILDENFELVSTFEGVRCDFTKQSVYCDDDYIYFCLDDADVIMVYDWNGVYQGVVALDDYLGSQETEGIAIRGGYAYVLVLDQDASTTTNAYKVTNILKYKLTLK